MSRRFFLDVFLLCVCIVTVITPTNGNVYSDEHTLDDHNLLRLNNSNRKEDLLDEALQRNIQANKADNFDSDIKKDMDFETPHRRTKRVAISTVASSIGTVFNGVGMMRSLIRSQLDPNAANLDEMQLQIEMINRNLDSLDAFLHGAVYEIINKLNRNAFAQSYNRLNNFITVYDGNNYDLPQEWISTILRRDDHGMEQTLLNFNRMLIGDPPLFDSIFLTFERSVRGSNNYLENIKAFLAKMLAMQANGYAILVHAKSRNNQPYRSVSDDFDRVYSEQGNIIRALNETMWPEGSWGLPDTKAGCPITLDFQWKTGHIKQRVHWENEWSQDNHFPTLQNTKFIWWAMAPEYTMTQRFCMKTGNKGEGQWPSGQYCVFRKNSYCPTGMACTGSLRWTYPSWHFRKIAKAGNKYHGTVPDHRSKDRRAVVKIYFACRSLGNATQEIELPTQRDFYLLRRGGTCQRVKNAIVSEEFVTWDLSIHDRIGRASQPAPDVEFIEETNRHGGPDNKLTLHYCHYRSTLFL